jgi:hypothetical protein
MGPLLFYRSGVSVAGVSGDGNEAAQIRYHCGSEIHSVYLDFFKLYVAPAAG